MGKQTKHAPPRHVAIVLDGNGRWAVRQGRSRIEGHIEGARAVERLIRFVRCEIDLPYLTLYAFSAENWNRPKAEVDALMQLLRQTTLDKLPEFQKAGIRLRVIGDLSGLPTETRAAVEHVIQETRHGNRLNLTMALNYGARQEIVQACQKLSEAAVNGALSVEAIDQATVSKYLYTADIPDPDLIIRTSGELRLSNFLLWQAAYAELAFPDVLWPDFTPELLLEILDEYQSRERRFGSVGGDASR